MDVPAHVSRRVFGALTLLGAAGLGVSGCAGRPKPTAGAMPIQKITYGDDPSQFGELYLPTGDRRVGTVVVIHGGFWLSGYGLDLGAPLAQDLAERGWVAWNIEYRRIGNGGGWPATVADVAAAVDHLSVLAESGDHGKIDLGHVVAVGHSAGGHLAGWLAGRPKLPAGAPGSDPSVKITGVVSQAGVLDLAVAADTPRRRRRRAAAGRWVPEEYARPLPARRSDPAAADRRSGALRAQSGRRQCAVPTKHRVRRCSRPDRRPGSAASGLG